MSLEVIVASACNLPNVESVGKTDPYVSIEYQGNRVYMCVVCILSCSLYKQIR